jgi:UDP-N-acetylenolpyruvoylglucosamine reductase
MKDESYYQSLDKRTKEYKEWVASMEQSSEGLGDTIEKITEAIGIKSVVKFLAGEDCGCTERKESLNKLFPYKKPECLTEDEYNYLINQMKVTKNVVTQSVQLKMLKIYNRVFHDNKQPTSCGSCFRETYNSLKKLIEQYN